MAPVTAAVGVVSAVSGIISSNQQASAQQASISASNKANEANYQNQLASVRAKKGYADYQANISNLTNQGLLSQQQLGIQYNNVISKIKESGDEFQNKQKVLQQQTKTVGEKGVADTIRFQAEQQALQTEGAGATQNIGAQNQIAQSATQDNNMLQTGMSQDAIQRAFMAAMQGNESWQSSSGAAQSESNINALTQRVASDRQMQNSAAAQAILQQEYMKQMAGGQRAYGNFAANTLSQNASNAQQYAESVGAYNSQAIQNQLANNDLASNTAVAQLQGAAALDALTNKANVLMSDQGLQQQANAAGTTFAAQKAALQAQSNSVQGASIGQYAQLGMGLYNLGSGLLSGFGNKTVDNGASSLVGSSQYSFSNTPMSTFSGASTQQPTGTFNSPSSSVPYSGFLSGNVYG
jgi:hypothetical protein